MCICVNFSKILTVACCLSLLYFPTLCCARIISLVFFFLLFPFWYNTNKKLIDCFILLLLLFWYWFVILFAVINCCMACCAPFFYVCVQCFCATLAIGFYKQIRRRCEFCHWNWLLACLLAYSLIHMFTSWFALVLAWRVLTMLCVCMSIYSS